MKAQDLLVSLMLDTDLCRTDLKVLLAIHIWHKGNANFSPKNHSEYIGMGEHQVNMAMRSLRKKNYVKPGYPYKLTPKAIASIPTWIGKCTRQSALWQNGNFISLREDFKQKHGTYDKLPENKPLEFAVIAALKKKRLKKD